MNLRLTRYYDTKDFTMGVLQLDDLVWCTIEDAHHVPKIKGKTRIPAGLYEIKTRSGTPMSKRYEDKFGSEHDGMLWLQNVKDFTYVYIHIGNDEDDTEGCILLGKTSDPSDGFIGNSTDAYKEMYWPVMDAFKRGESVTLTISDQLVGPMP